jgi:hypothetical protein
MYDGSVSRHRGEHGVPAKSAGHASRRVCGVHWWPFEATAAGEPGEPESPLGLLGPISAKAPALVR